MRFWEGKRVEEEKRADEEKSVARSHWKRSYHPSRVFLSVHILWFG
jgi:hypothetical protein